MLFNVSKAFSRCVWHLEGKLGAFFISQGALLPEKHMPSLPCLWPAVWVLCRGVKGCQTWQVQEGCGSKSKVYASVMQKLQILGYRVWAKGKMQTLAFCYFTLQGFRDLVGVIRLGGNVLSPCSLTP